jgi:glycosyltransferase involved in cell wall biosynthesis
MSAAPLVSVIVPTRQRHRLLPRCLRSLYSQTFRDFEVVLVDDNPPECAVAAQASLRGVLGDPRLRLVENPAPRNAATARNCGLRAARGRWITYLDDDDAYRPDKLASQVRVAEQGGAAVISCGLAYRMTRRARMLHVAQTEFAGDDLLLRFPAMPALFHARTDVLFDEGLTAAEDLYFYHALLRRLRVGRVCNVAQPLVDVYMHDGARVNLNAEAVWQGSLAVWRDFGGSFTERAREIFYLRSRLAYCKVRGGRLPELAWVASRLAWLHGREDGRKILGALLFQVPALRRFLIS